MGEETPYSQQTTVPNLQSKPDLPNTTTIFCRLNVALRVSGRLCMRVILRIVHIFIMYNITVCEAPAQNT